MIYQQINKELLVAIKRKDSIKDFIKVIKGEFDREGKDLSDEICLKIITKMYKNAKIMNAVLEINYLESFLPKLMDKDEIETQIAHYIDSGINNFGQLMGAFNQQFKGKANNKLVSQIVKKLINN